MPYLGVVGYKMQRILRYSILLFVIGCTSHEKSSSNSVMEAELSTRKGDELNFDSLVMLSEEDYRSNSDRHPMIPFHLSYDEWETIGCIVAINRDSYWNKTLIGLIEESNQLRLNWKNEEIHLMPDNLIEFDEGIWRNSYTNDSISASVLIDFKAGEILSSITGNGIIKIQINDVTYSESGYFVAKVKD